MLLLGTVHRHPATAEAVTTRIRAFRPDVITVEVSPYALHLRERHGPHLLARIDGVIARSQRVGQEALASRFLAEQALFLAAPTEWVAALYAGEEARVPVVAVDDSARSRRLLGAYLRDMLDPRVVRASLVRAASEPPLAERCAAELALARRLLAMGEKDRRLALQARFGTAPLEDLVAHDRAVAARIEEVLAERRAKRAVHVCGWMHVAAGQLAQLLAAHRPKGELAE